MEKKNLENFAYKIVVVSAELRLLHGGKRIALWWGEKIIQKIILYAL